MSQFILLLHEHPAAFKELSSAEMRKVIKKYTAWAKKIDRQGKLTGGRKLKNDGGKHLVLKSKTVHVHDGPFAEAKEIIGGFFAIHAEDYDEAVSIARSCPHLQFGGRVEIRQVDDE
jgi:hypothetical protein